MSAWTLRLLLVLGLLLVPASGAQAYVYYTSGNTSIGRTALDGTGKQPLVTGLVNPAGVAVSAEHIYWSSNLSAGDGTVSRARLDGTDKETLVTGLTSPQSVAVDDEYVYWGQAGGVNQIGRARLDGSEPDNAFITTTGSPGGLAVNDTHIFWSNSSAIGRASIDGSNANQTFVSGSSISTPLGLAVDDTSIYWTNFGTSTVGRAGIAGGGGTVFVPTSSPSRGVATNGSFVYWSNFFAGGNSYGRASADAASVSQGFITGTPSPYGIAVDGLRETIATVDCSPATPAATTPTTCTASVVGTGGDLPAVPGGAMVFSGAGAFPAGASCVLVANGEDSAGCSVAFAPSAPGNQQLAVDYAGDSNHVPVTASTTLSVGAAPPPPPPPSPPPSPSPSPDPPAAPRAPVSPPPAASNAFKFGKLRLNRKRGTATLVVRVPGKGRVVATGGKKVKRAVRRAGGKRTLRMPIRLKGKALRTLRRNGRAAVAVRVAFKPAGGSKRTRTRRVVLVLRQTAQKAAPPRRPHKSKSGRNSR